MIVSYDVQREDRIATAMVRAVLFVFEELRIRNSMFYFDDGWMFCDPVGNKVVYRKDVLSIYTECISCYAFLIDIADSYFVPRAPIPDLVQPD
jgi:hypothetical protein